MQTRDVAIKDLTEEPHVLFVGLAFMQGKRITIDIDNMRMDVQGGGAKTMAKVRHIPPRTNTPFRPIPPHSVSTHLPPPDRNALPNSAPTYPRSHLMGRGVASCFEVGACMTRASDGHSERLVLAGVSSGTELARRALGGALRGG